MNIPFADVPNYEIYALRYAMRAAKRKDHFIGGDPHDGTMPMDYFLWLIRGGGRTIVVDIGFTAEVAKARGRTFLVEPAELLRRLAVDPETVEDVILTHLHYDHAGNLPRFPKATFHIQEEEVSYSTGKYMCFHRFRHGYEVDDVVDLVRLVYKDRVRFYDGSARFAPGISLHRIGGHSAGLQCVRVHTTRGWVVLASDTTHFYENMDSHRPFPTVFHVGDMLEGFETLKRLADSRDHIIPGHDPKVMELYPPASAELAGSIARLDVPPLVKSNS